jgi:hypothetical protein
VGMLQAPVIYAGVHDLHFTHHKRLCVTQLFRQYNILCNLK